MFKYKYSAPPPKLRVSFQGCDVAELRHERDRYVFEYGPKFREMGLAPLPGLPEGQLHVSSELPRFFAERIPDTRRPEIRELILQKGIAEDNKLALLAELSRRSVTDPFELRAA